MSYAEEMIDTELLTLSVTEVLNTEIFEVIVYNDITYYTYLFFV